MRIIRKIPLLIILCSLGLILTVNLAPLTPVANTSNLTLEFLQIPQSTRSSTPLTVPKPPPTETVAIIVQNTIYSSISSAVTQYRQDLNDSGYQTILYTSVLTTAEQIKSNLTNWYNTYTNFVGAVLIGRLPYAQFYHPTTYNPQTYNAETFICDLFLQDLDGNWYDINPTNGIYDKHNASASANIYPEIYIGRIDPQSLVTGSIKGPGGTVVDYLNMYFARLHSYRIGGVQRQRRALTYIDDDWIPWATTYDNAVQQAYSTTTLVYTPGTTTTATDWLNTRLPSNYQWTHLCAHSSATTHFFGPGGAGEGTTTSTQIANVPPAFNFYNLFCCHGAEWTINDNLAVAYLFNSSYSVGVIGSTKTGGMLGNTDFYTPLGQNNTLGESLQNWFSNQLNTGGSGGLQYLEWFYGMNIVGDPFLSIWYDNTVIEPVISSSTHLPATWSATNQAQLNWTVPVDVNGIVGYYYILDQNPNTVPTALTGTYTTINGTQTGVLSDGIRYLHVVARDGAGNTGTSAGHFALYIDSVAPVVSITAPTTGQLVTGTSVGLTWTVVDTGSGYYQSQIFLDSSVYASVTNLSITVQGLLPGAHTLQVTASDATGATGTNSVSFTVQVTAPPPIPGFPIEAIALGAVLALGLGLVQKRRRRNK